MLHGPKGCAMSLLAYMLLAPFCSSGFVNQCPYQALDFHAGKTRVNAILPGWIDTSEPSTLSAGAATTPQEAEKLGAGASGTGDAEDEITKEQHAWHWTGKCGREALPPGWGLMIPHCHCQCARDGMCRRRLIWTFANLCKHLNSVRI